MAEFAIQDNYAVLGVLQNASALEIRSNFLKLSIDLHPDKNPGNPCATYNFQRLSAAYNILGDPVKRAAYDRWYNRTIGEPQQQKQQQQQQSHEEQRQHHQKQQWYHFQQCKYHHGRSQYHQQQWQNHQQQQREQASSHEPKPPHSDSSSTQQGQQDRHEQEQHQEQQRHQEEQQRQEKQCQEEKQRQQQRAQQQQQKQQREDSSRKHTSDPPHPAPDSSRGSASTSGCQYGETDSPGGVDDKKGRQGSRLGEHWERDRLGEGIAKELGHDTETLKRNLIFDQWVAEWSKYFANGDNFMFDAFAKAFKAKVREDYQEEVLQTAWFQQAYAQQEHYRADEDLRQRNYQTDQRNKQEQQEQNPFRSRQQSNPRMAVDEGKRAELLENIASVRNRWLHLTFLWNRMAHELWRVQPLKRSRDVWKTMNEIDDLFVRIDHELEGMQSIIFPLSAERFRHIIGAHVFPQAQKDLKRLDTFLLVADGHGVHLHERTTQITNAVEEAEYEQARIGLVEKAKSLLRLWPHFAPRGTWPERKVKDFGLEGVFKREKRISPEAEEDRKSYFEERQQQTSQEVPVDEEVIE